MKKKRFLAAVLCVSLSIGFLSIQVGAHERQEHDAIMLDVLFRKYEYAYKDKSVKDDIDAITSACYLSIDQFNSNGQKDLDILISYGVKDLPKDVSEIGYKASGKNHRDFTHRGWDFSYTGEMKTLWPIRQDVLRNTVSKVFDMDVSDKQLESFCELLYYIHILADHEDDETYKISNGLKMGVGGQHDNEDIIHKLLSLFKVLFADQVHTHKYRALTSNLKQINSELSKLVNSQGGINTDEKFAEHKILVQKTLTILSYYVPEMLKKEPFFNNVFYQHIENETILDWLENLLNAA